jgi:hypothetical protein
MKRLSCLFIISISSISLTGCGGGASADADSRMATSRSVDAAKYVLAEEPDGAIGVIAARAEAKHGDPVVLVGRIGGSANPWVDGRAAFMLLDASVIVVANGTESAPGQVCMDDCCAIARAESTTLVKVVDVRGTVLAADARKLFGIAADDMVVVRGKVNKDEAGNFVVLADGVHVRK